MSGWHSMGLFMFNRGGKPLFAAFIFALFALLQMPLAFADETVTPSKKDKPSSTRVHGLSTFGALKYEADFTHLEYANPNAPKGGKLALIGTEARITFGSFNLFIRKGDRAQGLDYLYDSLMARAYDEPDAVYGLLAHSAEVHNDKKGVTFFLRPEAKFADGVRVKASDVVFTINTLKSKGHPRYRVSLRDVDLVEAIDELTVRFRFKGDQTRDLPQRVAELPIIPEHFYKNVPFEKAGLDLPIGSGPYEVGKFQQGRYVRLRVQLTAGPGDRIMRPSGRRLRPSRCWGWRSLRSRILGRWGVRGSSPRDLSVLRRGQRQSHRQPFRGRRFRRSSPTRMPGVRTPLHHL